MTFKNNFKTFKKDPKTALIKELKQEIFKLRELLAKTSFYSTPSNPLVSSNIF